MKTIKGKITKSEFKKEWPNPKGGIIYFHEIEIDGEHTGQIGSKDKLPKFLNVGEEIEVEVTETEYGKKFKRAKPDFKPNYGGGNKKVRTYDDIKRGCKGTAIKAAATINKAGGRILIDEDGCNVIARFVLGDIRGDLPKWDAPESEMMMSRQTSIHAAADEFEAHEIATAERLVEVAKEKYQYIIS